jgi:hypothetical protein
LRFPARADAQQAPFCADASGGELAGAPSWCYQQFCYVDKVRKAPCWPSSWATAHPLCTAAHPLHIRLRTYSVPLF